MTKLTDWNMRKLAVGKLDSDMLEKIVLREFSTDDRRLRLGQV